MQDDELRLFRLGIPQTFFSSFIKRTSLKFAFLLLIRLFFVCLVLEADLLTYNYQYRCTLGSHWAKKKRKLLISPQADEGQKNSSICRKRIVSTTDKNDESQTAMKQANGLVAATTRNLTSNRRVRSLGAYIPLTLPSEDRHQSHSPEDGLNTRPQKAQSDAHTFSLSSAETRHPPASPSAEARTLISHSEPAQYIPSLARISFREHNALGSCDINRQDLSASLLRPRSRQKQQSLARSIHQARHM